MIDKLQACRMGSEREEERKLTGCLLTLLTVTDSYLNSQCLCWQHSLWFQLHPTWIPGQN